MVDFVELAEVAQELIEENGRDAVLFKKSRVPKDAGKPFRGPDLSAPVPAGGVGPVKVAFIPASGSGFGKVLFDADETLRVKIDEVGLLAVNSVTDLVPPGTVEDVEQADTLRDGSKVYKIRSVGHLKPGDTSLIFVLGLAL